MPVIDIHEHVWTHPHYSHWEGDAQVINADELVASMDRRGIDQMVILPIVTPETFPMVQSNEHVFEVCDRHPGRFIKFCNADPRCANNSLDHDFVPLLEYYKKLGAKGLGEITCNLWWDDPRVQNLFSACEKVRMPVLFHIATHEFGLYGLVESPGLKGLERALQKFPNLPFLGHSQPFWSEVGIPKNEKERGGYPEGPVDPEGAVPRLMREYPNLYGDLSAGSGCNAIARDKEWGPKFITEFQDRLLMGMDLCLAKNDSSYLSPDALKEYLDQGAITWDVYDKVMGENAAKLLNL
jgi:uncharacterized protein